MMIDCLNFEKPRYNKFKKFIITMKWYDLVTEIFSIEIFGNFKIKKFVFKQKYIHEFFIKFKRFSIKIIIIFSWNHKFKVW